MTYIYSVGGSRLWSWGNDGLVYFATQRAALAAAREAAADVPVGRKIKVNRHTVRHMPRRQLMVALLSHLWWEDKEEVIAVIPGKKKEVPPKHENVDVLTS